MSTHTPRTQLVRALVLGVVMAVFAVVVPSTGAATAAPDTDKIKPQLAQQLEDKGSADFWIRFEQADLRAASQVAGWDARGQAVYDALTDAARSSQKQTRALLDNEDVGYEAFFVTNAIRVENGDAELATRLSAQPAVVSLHPTSEYEVEEPTVSKRVAEVEGLEWGVGEHQRRRRVGAVRHPRRGHGHRQHRHRRPVRPPGAGRPVPRQQRRRHLHPRLQLVQRRRHLRRQPLRHQRSRHPHHGHDGR